MSRSVKVECYGSTRPREGSTANQDAYWIWRPSSAVAALCDGVLIEAAARHGRADDMTVVALRLRLT